MESIIREATIIDCEKICGLLNNELELNLEVNFDVLTSQFNKMKATGNYEINVAIYDSQIIGFVAAYKSMILEMPNEYMRIIGLSVARQYRRQGIGTKLMQSIVQYAREHDIAYIALNTLPNADADHMFYESNGFTKKSVCYSKALN